ncbi:hypothetical protein [Maribacter sp.]
MRLSIGISIILGSSIFFFGFVSSVMIPNHLFSDGLLLIQWITENEIWKVILFPTGLISLGLGGKIMYHSILKGYSLIKSSFKYALLTNSILWTVLSLLITYNATSDVGLFLILGLMAFICCVFLTTFTTGLLIAYLIKAFGIRGAK